MTILIVDDDEELRAQLSESLERKRYRIETAANGEQADIPRSPNKTTYMVERAIPPG